MPLRSSALLLGLLAQAHVSAAQTPAMPRAGMTTTFGITGFPDALGKQCGTAVNGKGVNVAPDLNAGLVVRIRKPWVVQVDNRLAYQMLSLSGCYAVLPAVDTVYDARMSRDLFGTTSIRFGVETPPSLPLVRFTAGIGTLWGSPVMPIGVFGLAVSTRGPHKRFLVEAERSTARVHADERHSHPAGDGSPFSNSLRFSASTFTVRLGMEWAFASKADSSRSQTHRSALRAPADRTSFRESRALESRRSAGTRRP